MIETKILDYLQRTLDTTYVAPTYRRFPIEIVRGSGSIVFDETGKEVSEISSKDMSTKEFNRCISELKAEYGFYKCHTFDSREEAEGFVAKQREEKVKKVRRQTSD